MINGNVNNFLENIRGEDCYIIFMGNKYLINGCQCKFDDNGNILNSNLEIYNLTSNTTIFSTTQPSIEQCIVDFKSAPIWNGQKFYDVESSMIWID